MHDIFLSFPLPVGFSLLYKSISLNILLWEKYCNYPLTTTQSDSCFASCEKMVSPSQTSSLPPRTRPRDDDKFPLNLTTNTQDNKKTFENKGEDNTPNILLRRDALIY